MTSAEPTTVNAEQWRQRGELLALDGRRMFVIDEGDANQPVILLIHGFPTASWDWWKIWGALRRHYRLVAMDMLGFGFSDKPAGHPYSIMEQADLFAALVRAKGLGRFHVLAHDYGDTVAQELLARQNDGDGPGQWLSLCMLNGGLFPETHHAVLAQRLLLSPLGSLVNRLMGRGALDANLRKVFGTDTQPSQEDLEGFWELINHNEGKQNLHRLIHYMTDRREHRERWVGALAAAGIPIGLVNGSKDPVSGDHMIARYIELLGEPQFLVRLSSIGHYPQYEAPVEVAGAVLDFFASVTSNASCAGFQSMRRVK